MTVQVTEKVFISVPAAAIRLGKNKQTLLRWINKGKFPPGIVHRPVPGANWLIDVEALDEWVRSTCYAPSPSEGDAA